MLNGVTRVGISKQTNPDGYLEKILYNTCSSCSRYSYEIQGDWGGCPASYRVLVTECSSVLLPPPSPGLSQWNSINTMYWVPTMCEALCHERGSWCQQTYTSSEKKWWEAWNMAECKMSSCGWTNKTAWEHGDNVRLIQGNWTFLVFWVTSPQPPSRFCFSCVQHAVSLSC